MSTQKIQLPHLPHQLNAFLIPLGRPNGASYAIGNYATIGRDQQNEICLNDPAVSSRHARIDKTDDGFRIRDLRSTNGTYVNSARVQEVMLNLNDKIRIGDQTFLLAEFGEGFTNLKSGNAAWNSQLLRLPAFAATEFPVLISGPSGSGKEVIARWIHKHSARSRGPFVSINCSALSESLIESELFGHLRGSFTGAANDRKGAFETARGGTLFLDEIGDLPLSLQPKLLRALENCEIRPVGSDRNIETDVRVLAATHKDIQIQVLQNHFREDLYYRLKVCHISPPALKDRLEDFDELFYQFAKLYKVRFSFGALQRMKEHTWPGQIRELKNTVARAAAYFPGEHIQPEHVEQILDHLPQVAGVRGGRADLHQAVTSGNIVNDIERELIIQRLSANRGNQRRTATDLGMPKSTLHDRIKFYGINLEQLKGTSTV